MATELEIEQEIQDKGLTAARLTPADIDNAIIDEAYYVFPNTTFTVCLLTLKNGFNVSGESAAASLENFDAEIGRKIAKDNARTKIWALEGYLLKQKLFDA
jgi:AAA15 family ATPase/GTPase